MKQGSSIRHDQYTTYYRMYDPQLGRWLSIDPVTDASSSPYVAMGDNPIVLADPSGAQGDTVFVTADRFYGPPDPPWYNPDNPGSSHPPGGSLSEGLQNPRYYPSLQGGDMVHVSPPSDGPTQEQRMLNGAVSRLGDYAAPFMSLKAFGKFLWHQSPLSRAVDGISDMSDYFNDPAGYMARQNRLNNAALNQLIKRIVTPEGWGATFVDYTVGEAIGQVMPAPAAALEANEATIASQPYGNPAAVYNGLAELSTRQQSLLGALEGPGSQVIIRKNSVSLADLAALTAETGDEFLMLTRGSERLIMRGTPRGFHDFVDLPWAEQMASDGWRWSGHTHPTIEGVGELSNLSASSGDEAVLEVFRRINGQQGSVILNSKGRLQRFGEPHKDY